MTERLPKLPRRLAPPVLMILVVLAMVWPTLGTWLYFQQLAGSELAGPAYGATKIVQFALPLPYLGALLLALRGHAADWRLGGALAACVLGAMLVLYVTALANGSLAAAVRPPVREKIAEFGLAHPAAYAVFALFLSGLHSLLEELYWRGFVYGGLRTRLSVSSAALLSSLAFTAHHVIVIAAYADRLGGVTAMTAIALAALGVGLGGWLWCRLYERMGNLIAAWLSHAAADGAILAAGAHLVWAS